MLQFDEEGIAWTCNYLQKICQTISDTVKNNLKIQILKLLKDQKILKNQMIHGSEIIETKQYIYIYIYMTKKIKKYKKKIGLHSKE